MKGNTPDKDCARNVVLSTAVEQPNNSSFLTMPGPDFTFEDKLLEMRPNAHFKIDAIECNIDIFSEAQECIPGPTGIKFKRIEIPKWSRNVEVSKGHIRYIKTTAEEFTMKSRTLYNFVWLDYCGPPTRERLEAARKFFKENIIGDFFLTFTLSRYKREIKPGIMEHGDLKSLIIAAVGIKPTSAYEYKNGIVPLIQYRFRKK